MRRVLPAVLAVALTLGAVAGPAVADELEQRRSELEEVNRRIAEIEARLDAAADELEAIDRRLGDANAELRRIRADLAAAEAGSAPPPAAAAAARERERAAEARLVEVEARSTEVRDRLQARIVQTFKYGRTATADIIMRGTVGALDLHDLAVTLATVGRITDDDRTLVADLRSLATEVTDLIAEAVDARTAAVVARDEATRQRDRVAELEADQRRVVAGIDAERRRQRQLLDELENDVEVMAALAKRITEQIRALELQRYSALRPVGGVWVGVPSWAPRLPAQGQPYSALVASAAATQGVDDRLLGALTWTESGFRPGVVSHAGAAGLTQLMPGTARGLGLRVDSQVDERFDPERNLNGGAQYLRLQLVRFGSVELALAAYNAGPTRVARCGCIPDITETQFYVLRVLSRFQLLSS
ncbi:MAG: transglycosylase SLT domain-containing protein [Nitriliruptoraceae bacterium]